MEHYNLIVIGAGSGGMKAAKLAASQGKKVVVIEQDAVGGTCVNRGCMPKKIIFYSANLQRYLNNPGIARLGWQGEKSVFQWEKLQATVARVVAILSRKNSEKLTQSNVPIIKDQAKFKNKHTLQLAKHGEISADHLVIAVGGEPCRPEIAGKELVMSSDDIFELAHLPKKLVVIGGGYIAVEFACMFRALGSEVTLVQRNNRLLRGFDQEAVTLLIDHMRHAGIELILNKQLSKVSKSDQGLTVSLDDGQQLMASHVLAAIGRKPRTAGLALAEAGVEQRADLTIVTNDRLQTSQPHIYAVGDVTGALALTPVATRQAEIFASHCYGDNDSNLQVDFVPKAVFSLPPLASVGLSEEQARAISPEVKVYRNAFSSLQANLVREYNKTLFKIITIGKEEKVVGFHALADEAADIIQVVAIALTAGITKKELDLTIKLHPTIAEELLFCEA